MNAETAEGLHRIDLNSIYRGRTAVLHGLGLTIAEVHLETGGGDGEWRLVDRLPDAAPAGWIEGVQKALVEGDAALRHTSRAQAARDRKRHRRRDDAARALRSVVTDSSAAHGLLNTSEWTTKLRGARQTKGRHGPTPAAYLVKDGAGAVRARALLPNGPVFLAEEWERSAVIQVLRDNHEDDFGHMSPKIDHLEPFLDASIWPQRSDALCYHVTIGEHSAEAAVLARHDGSAGHVDQDQPVFLRAAVFYPTRRTAIAVSREWSDALANLLERHGWQVDQIFGLDDCPDEFDNDEVRRTLNGDEETWLRQPLPEIVYKPSTLTDFARPLVADSVADTVEQLWRHRSAASWEPYDAYEMGEQGIALLLGATPDVALPDSAEGVWARAAQVSRVHAPFIAALELRRVESGWWDALPWNPVVDRTGTRGRSGWIDPSMLIRTERDLTGQPELCGLMASRGFSVPRGLGDGNASAKVLLAAAQFFRIHPIIDLEHPPDQDCALCGSSFEPSRARLAGILLTGANRYCIACNSDALSAAYLPSQDMEITPGAIAAVQRLATINNGPVAPAHFSAAIQAVNDQQRDEQVLLRIASAPFNSLELQREAGVLDHGWRPSFGTYTTATDGHPCRSMFERYVDDFLSGSGIPHEIEPHYPFDAELNTTGLMADWRLNDGTLVEAAGMMGVPAYAAKMSRKRQLADRHGIRLIVVTPSDLADLRAVFSSELG